MREIVISLLLLNCMTFFWIRLHSLRWDLEFDQYSPGEADDLVFLIAGNLNQPKPAFEFLKSELEGKACVYMSFSNLGFSAKTTAERIVDIILLDEFKRKEPRKKITILTISLGDHTGRYVDGDSALRRCETLEIYAVNPCPTLNALQKQFRLPLKIGAPIFEVLCHALGWLSAIPIISAPDGKYSLILLADQYWTLAYDEPPHETQRTKGVILSANDELLDNAYLEQVYFLGSRIAEVPTSHGNTIDMGAEYLRGIQKLWSH